MRKHLVFGLCLLVVGWMMAGCEGGGGGDDDGGDSGGGSGGSAAGTWDGTGHYEYHSVPITKFHLVISQDGSSLSGSYRIKRDARDEMNGSLSGTVDGGDIHLEMNPHGYANGSISGSTMSLTWHETGFGTSTFTGSRDAQVTVTK